MRKTLTSSPPTYISSSPLHAAAAIMAPRFANRMNWFYAYDDVVRTMYAPPTLFCTISGENITAHSVMARTSLFLMVFRKSIYVIEHHVNMQVIVMILNIRKLLVLSAQALQSISLLWLSSSCGSSILPMWQFFSSSPFLGRHW